MIDFKQHHLYKPMEVDTVLSKIFTLYFKKFFVLFISSFIGVFIIQMILFHLGFGDLYTTSDPEEMVKMLPDLMGKISVVSITSVIIYGFLNAFLVSYIIKSDNNSNIHAGDILIESLRKYAIHMIFFLILSMLIVIAGAFLGIIALIIGSFIAMIYLGTVLMVGGTIVVVEEKNAIDTIGRCFALTHKDFWPALGIVVLFILIMLLISLVMSAIISIPIVIMFFENFRETGNIIEAFNLQNYDIGIWSILLNSIVGALTYPLYAILSVVLYFKLKYTEDQKELPLQ